MVYCLIEIINNIKIKILESLKNSASSGKFFDLLETTFRLVCTTAKIQFGKFSGKKMTNKEFQNQKLQLFDGCSWKEVFVLEDDVRLRSCSKKTGPSGVEPGQSSSDPVGCNQPWH